MTVTIGRRELLAALGGAVVAWPLAAMACAPEVSSADGRRTIVTYDNWKTTEPDPGDYEPFGECHWCGYRAQLYRMWLLTGVEGWFCSDCAEELETESRIKHRPVVRSNKPIYRRCGER